MLHAQSNFFTLDFFHQTSSIFLLTSYIFHLTSYIIHIVVSLFFRSWQGDGKVLASINSLLELANPLPTTCEPLAYTMGMSKERICHK